jgi:hypothetical protein
MRDLWQLTLTDLLVPPTSLRSLALLSLSRSRSRSRLSSFSSISTAFLSLSLSFSLSLLLARRALFSSLRVPRAWKVGLRGYGKAGYDVTNKYIGVGGKR